MKHYIYVLDYSDSTISEIIINFDDDVIESLINHGFDPDNCSWLVSDNKLELNYYE